MSHPYSAAASYIYANEYVPTPTYPTYPSYDRFRETAAPLGPYSNLRSIMPMHSLITLQQSQSWPDDNRISMQAVSEPRLSTWSSEYGLIISNRKQSWRRRTVRGFQKRVRGALRNIHSFFTLRWVTIPRPSLSTVNTHPKRDPRAPSPFDF